MTNQNHVAGFNLEDVFRNEEARRAREKQEQEELKRKRDALEEARKRREGKGTKPARDLPKAPPVIIQPVSYHNLIWEPQAYREEGQAEKKLFTFDKSLERLREAGYDRHPSPRESFSLLIDYLEGTLSQGLEAIANDMLASYGEWFSMAAERKKNILILSSDPTNLRWKKDKYVLDGRVLQCTGQQEFQIGKRLSEKYIDLKDVPEDLVTFLYSKPFSQLPGEMRKGNNRAQIYLPPEGVIRPVGRSGFGWFGVSFVDRASRGVGRASVAQPGGR